MYDEDELLPLSAVQHLLFCRRRAALVHLEGLWEENIFTAEGKVAHERAHEVQTESRGTLRIVRGLWLQSQRLGLVGRADVVEFHRVQPEDEGTQARDNAAVTLPDVDGLWSPFPVEYKSGKLRNEEGYTVQLCAQAICLEEMLKIPVARGALFFGKTARRQEVEFDEALRIRTEEAAAEVQHIFRTGLTPAAEYGNKCKKCSLLSQCLPRVTSSRPTARSYIRRVLVDMEEHLP